MSKQYLNNWYRSVGVINPVLRYLVTVVVMSAMICLWYFLLYRPLTTAKVWYQKNVGLVHKKQLSLVKLNETIGYLESRLQVHAMHEPTQKEARTSLVHTLEDFLLDRIHRSQLQITEYQKGKTITKKWFSKTMIFVSCNGSKKSCIAFLHDLKKEQAMIEITEFSYEAIDTQTVRMMMHCYLIDPIIKKSLQPIDKLKGEGVNSVQHTAY
jgi:hypothetical protein